MNKSVIFATAGGVVVGAVGGYFYAKNRLEAGYVAAVNAEIEALRESYVDIRKNDMEKAKIAEKFDEVSRDIQAEAVLNQEHLDILRRYQSGEIQDGEVQEEKTVFDEYPAEEPIVTVESDTDPFLISIEEFMTEHDEYDKITITYFDGDNTLADERDVIIVDWDFIGEDTLNHFGERSQNEHIVYVRNHRLRSDYEVTRDLREYSEAILGEKAWARMQPEEPRRRPKKNGDGD